MQQDNTLSTVEAGLVLGFTRRWILQLIRRNQLEAVKIGRDWRVSRESVENYAEHLQVIKNKQAANHPQ